ncbi:hypothetical protein JB92DRAFT_466863 [Gautieria morchelliformis]|nr:hypothetical protein JB92DRAFT_466863 [Gautieria morchelliformis]
MQALIWPLKESEVHKTLDELGKLQDLLTTAMDVDQTRLTLKIDSGVESLQERTAEISQAIGQAKLQEHLQEIYKWLAAPDHRSKHRNACNLRQAMTGSWFIEGKHFQEWREVPHSFLWLHGIRMLSKLGDMCFPLIDCRSWRGKTILCSTIVEELSRHCRSDPLLAMASFYFDFNNKDTPPDAVLRSLIAQLSVQCASTPHALESLFSKTGQDGAPGQEDLMSTLKTIISGFQAMYIVFDALDECPERSRFLAVIREIHGWEFGLLHLLATSRKERDIEEALSGLISQEVRMDENLVDGDIRVHVSRTLEDDIKFRMCTAEEKEKMMAALMEGAHGMFRWVVCQLDALRKCRTPAALEKALMRLPKTLNETYDRILAAIDEDDRQDALSLLQWLTFSVRTISTDEAVEVLATDPDAREGPLFDPRRRLRDPSDILTICSSLVTITFREGSNAEDDNYEDSNNKGSIDHHDDRVPFTETREIRLAHFSVREYLISEHLLMSTSMLSCYYFNEKIAHVFIAKTCLAYLLQFDQDNGVNLNTAWSYPLSCYAADNWLDHAGWDRAGDWDDLHGLIVMLLEPTSAVYMNWMWLYCHNKPWECHHGMNPLYIMAEKGLE